MLHQLSSLPQEAKSKAPWATLLYSVAGVCLAVLVLYLIWIAGQFFVPHV
jgi:hypothetical protein